MVVVEGKVIVGIWFTVIVDIAMEEGQPGAETVTLIVPELLGFIVILDEVEPSDQRYVALFGRAVRVVELPLQTVGLFTDAVIP
jgi:hypothetical protein